MQEKSISDLQQAMSSGDLSAAGLTSYYLERIEAYDSRLGAVIEINPDAAAIAEALDDERAATGTRGPLHGIPILLKDNIDTGDRMQTTAGSLALEGHHAAADAFLVERLRKHGAVILGKTNLSEWANFRGKHSSSGWSSRGGQTRNPYALDRSPCGSSSGSGAAAAADFCTAAIGTETDGSIVCPAAINGIVGIKPTVGLVSRSGIIPISHSQDTAGPMARSVADAAAVLSGMTGADPADPATVVLSGMAGADPSDPTAAAAKGKALIDYTQFLDADGLAGARIGVASNYLGALPVVDKIFHTAVEAMRTRGAEIIEKAPIDTVDQFRKGRFEVMLYEFKHGLNKYLAQLGPEARVHSLADVIQFNTEHADRVMPHFGQELHLQAQEKGPLTDPDYLEALAECRRLSRTEGIDRLIHEHELDALIAPTMVPAWLIDWLRGDLGGGSSSSPAAVAGYPSITVPAGYVRGLPIGISFFGPAWSEPTLVRLAYAFEQATKVRMPPQFLETVEYA